MNAVEERKKIETIHNEVKAHLPEGWDAYVGCFISFSTMQTTKDHVSISRNTKPLKDALKAATSDEERKQIRKDWYVTTQDMAARMAVSLKADGYRVTRDGGSLYINP